MAKQYKVKDINNNGKIDGWEQGKYDAINSPTKMIGAIAGKINKTLVKGANNYIVKKHNVKEVVETASGSPMQLGSKEIDSPTNFSKKSAMLMSKAPMYMSFELADVTKDQNNIYDEARANAPSYTVTNPDEADTTGYSALGKNLGNIFKSKEERFGKDSDVVKQKQAVRAQRERIKANRLQKRANRLSKK